MDRANVYVNRYRSAVRCPIVLKFGTLQGLLLRSQRMPQNG